MVETLRGKWALVTGASGGLGTEFASALAALGVNLILSAREQEPLNALAGRLRAHHGITVRIEPADLTDRASPAMLVERVADAGIVVDVLINNAGFGYYGEFVEQDADRLRRMLELNVFAMTELTHFFAAQMVSRGSGHILLVASMTGHQPVPTYAVYAASKAYVIEFGESLHPELITKNVTLTVLSPGLMNTGFLGAAGQELTPSMKRTMMEPALAVKIGLEALFAGKPSVIAGRMNNVMAFSNRFTARSLQAKVAYKMMKG